MKTEKILNIIINDDSITVMNQMEPNSVDVIFADPPYNMQLGDTSQHFPCRLYFTKPWFLDFK